MSHVNILSGFAAVAVGLSMLGGALPAPAVSTTSLAATSQSSDHDDDNECWDVNFYKHRGHWYVTWTDSAGKHTKRADTYRDAVQVLRDACDRLSHQRVRADDRDRLYRRPPES